MQVKIGPSFFKNEFKEYADWRFAFVREANQNCMDAPGDTIIDWTIEEKDGDTIVSFSNNGRPMSEDILLNKLLALGESGKRFEGCAGGFGKAKGILLFCHKSWQVVTGTIVATGAGGEFELSEGFFDGTKTIVTMEGSHKEGLERCLRRFAGLAQWRGTFRVNGESHTTSLKKGSPRRDLGFGVVYTNRSFRNLMVVRINGQPMFMEPVALDRCVVVELAGKSSDVLTSNRDGLVRPFSSELSVFVTELAVDKRAALKDRASGPEYTWYSGSQLSHRRDQPDQPDRPESGYQEGNIRDLVAGEAFVDERSSQPIESVGGIDGVDVGGGDDPGDPVTREDGVTRTFSLSAGAVSESAPMKMWETLGSDFVIKNESGMVVPDYYKPEGELSGYSRKLIRYWGRILLELHRLFDREDSFSIGFFLRMGLRLCMR